MANLKFDITSLYQQAFGTNRGKPFDVSKVYKDEFREGSEFDGLETLAQIDQEGTEFVNIRETLKARTPLGHLIFMPMEIGGVLLPNEPTIMIAGKKKIEKTGLVGSKRRGSVKELIRIDDYSITIRGIALNYNSKKVYPEDIVKQLNDLHLRREALSIKCALTSLLGIYRLVIDDVRFTEMIGVQHAQAYEFLCTSDEDFILTKD